MLFSILLWTVLENIGDKHMGKREEPEVGTGIAPLVKADLEPKHLKRFVKLPLQNWMKKNKKTKQKIHLGLFFVFF